ncbi:MAG: phosphoadenylyl-sulfate reductase [Alphaproteobacteria bacterium]|nr:phosphoadenylyl-sulfate reductase [Alphaproteobacteria bacterium]
MRGDHPIPSQSHNTAHMRAARLMNRVPDGVGEKIMRAAIEEVFPFRVGVLSSFGAESAVILHQVAQIDPATPVLFLETGQLFAQTLQYQEELSDRLGLTDVRVIRPDPVKLAKRDPNNDLWKTDPGACCHLRKVVPLETALEGFDAWITGRKRFQGGTRTTLPVVEVENRRVKVNPLAGWSQDRLDAYFAEHDLPRHPLWEFGYLSIGCHPCTRPVAAGEDPRAGRWSGRDKTECGIHGNKWG